MSVRAHLRVCDHMYCVCVRMFFLSLSLSAYQIGFPIRGLLLFINRYDTPSAVCACGCSGESGVVVALLRFCALK